VRQQSGRLGYVGEGAVAVVAVQHVRLRLEGLRAAVDRLPVAGAADERIRRIDGVVGDVEVDPSVQIVVAEGGPRAQPGIAHTRRCGHIGEGAVAVVAV